MDEIKIPLDGTEFFIRSLVKDADVYEKKILDNILTKARQCGLHYGDSE